MVLVLPIKYILFIGIFLYLCACSPTVIVTDRSGGVETIERVVLSEAAHVFRCKGGERQINFRDLSHINIFSDTIEIYAGSTWCRADVYYRNKDTIPVALQGWIKVTGSLSGECAGGNCHITIPQIRQIRFQPEVSEEFLDEE